jgi:sarcosine oxidase subunit beta
MSNKDVVIIGAGIIGLSIAWQIARRSSLKVVVLEKGRGVGEGSTGASSAVCRHRYTREEMVHLARDGIHAYRNWPQFTGLEHPRAEFQQKGILWMPGDDRAWSQSEHKRMAALGVATQLLNDEDLRSLYPSMNACSCVVDVLGAKEHDCSGGTEHLLEVDGGYIDPVSAAEDLVQACRASGVEVTFCASVVQVGTIGGRVEGVSLADGSKISAPCVINAAGPWCNRIFESLSFEPGWVLRPTRIQMLYLDRPAELVGDLPVTVDMNNGIYFRLLNRGQQIVVGSVLEEDEQESVTDPDDFNRFSDEDFTVAKLHVLHHRLPTLPYRGAIAGYSGLYTVNQQDVHPIVGETAIPGFMVANGFSGHGFKLAPAIGSMIARLITGTRTDFDTEVAVDFFAINRKPIEADSKSVLA